MALKIKLRNDSARDQRRHQLTARLRRYPLGRIALGSVVVLAVLFGGLFWYFYVHFQHVVEQRLARGPLFAPVAQVYAAPREVRSGQKFTVDEIAEDLHRAGYNLNPKLGTYQVNGDQILVRPGEQSYFSSGGATVNATGGVVQSITAENGATLRAFQLEPQLITALSEDQNRTKRRLVTYDQIPRRMVQAVTAIEDRRFFDHGGVDYHRLAGAFVHDISGHSRVVEGGSTITMQLARGFFLTPARNIKRKLAEIMITFQLEHRFNKQQIFEMYANQINLGQRGSFAVNGFGEAAQAFFGKDLRQLSTAECALLAGTIQSPNRLNPYRHPERAMERRNLVLDAMAETGSLTPAEAIRAKAEPLHLAPQNVDASEAPYFVDMVHEQLAQRISDNEIAHDSLRIYTSLDPELQRAASAAVEAGMPRVDEMVRKLHKTPKDGVATPITYPQVALVALDPHTGQVLALVGGRNYGQSQYNHATAKRPTGSIFKPFVYAAAYNMSLNGTQLGDGQVFTATTILHDEATTFTYSGGQTYNPRNKLSGYRGDVTAAYALAHSLNAATVSLGQQVGFENVAALARASGVTAARGTPAVALGSYDATPLDMAGAYTVFANGGVHLTPWLLASVRNTNGDIVSDFTPQATQVMDPRAAYLTQSLLEGVMNYGTAAGVRSRGFLAPAAGKTGTSHDVWFAAYSSNLLCVVWIGNDDYSDLGRLQGATAAAPIWADFMNRAIKLPQYSDMRSFSAPGGITVARLDKVSNLLADSSCPDDYNAAFLDGTAPTNTCAAMGDTPASILERVFGNGGDRASTDPNSLPPPIRTDRDGNPLPGSGTTRTDANGNPLPDSAFDTNPDGTPRKKRGFFGRLFGGKDKQKQPAQPETPSTASPPPQ